MTNPTEQNPRKLISLVALIYFVFVVNLLIKWNEKDFELNESDVYVINTYKKAWYIVWLFTFVIIILFAVSIRFSFVWLSYTIYVLLTVLIWYIFYNIYLIFSDKEAFIFTKGNLKAVSVNKVESGNMDYLFLYLPFLNFFLFVKKQFSEKQSYWLKESNLLYFLLATTGFFALFFSSFINIFYIILWFIIVRVVSLFFWIDFIQDNIKEKIYNLYNTNPVEIFAYLCALFHFFLWNIYLLIKWKKTLEYGRYLYNVKEMVKISFDIKSILKKPKKYLFLILSYVVLIVLLWYLIYKWYHSFTYLYLFAIILFAYYLLLPVYIDKKLYFLPFISWILQQITKKF